MKRENPYSTDSTRIRLSLVITVFAVLAVGMLVRSSWIQIIQDPKLANLAKRQFQSKILMKPRRGLILDRTGEPLAINLETSSLAGSPQKILKSKSSLTLLANALGTQIPQLKKRLDGKKNFAWFERHLSDERMERFRKLGLIQPSGEMPEGIWIVKEMKRVYPHGNIANALIGGVNIDTDGIEGVELWKNKELRGKSASINAFRDALGRPTLMQNESQNRMQDGESVELSIDSSLQYSVEELLNEAIEKTSADSGMVIVMDAENGEILTLAQGPNFRGVKKVRALTDGYEPGSTMKPLILASAIQKGVLKVTDALFGHYGKMTLQGRTISEAEAHEKFGMISMKKMIEVSSNVVAAELALKLGSERLVTTFRELGFGSKTGVSFPGEISGKTPQTAKGLRPLSIATMGFGQGILVTPLQMIRAYAALSNGGVLVEPTLLKRKENEELKRSILYKPSTVRDVTDALLLVTEGEKGTGHKARVDGFRIAGKTGTAQTVDPKTKRYSTSRHIASFIGYPVNVKKPVVVLTILDHPRGIYYASETAAPLFSKVLTQVASRFSIPTTETIKRTLAVATPTPHPETQEDGLNGTDQNTIQTARSSAQSTAERSLQSIREINSDHPVMPSLIGLTPQEAISALRPFGPQIKVQGFGLIRRQIPESGAVISDKVRVTLYLEE